MARKLPRLQRALDAPTLASVAYGEIASSIYFALGIIALHALGLTPVVLGIVGLLFVVPGRGDTLRINGRARLLRDADFFDQMTVKGHRPRLALLKEGLLSLSAVPALLIGFLPGLIWGARNNWANVSYLLHSGGTFSAGRLLTIAAVTRMYTYCLVPRALGGALPTQPDVTTANPHLVTFGLFVVVSGLVLGVAGLLLASRYPVFMRIRQLTALPLLFMLCVSIIF